jgi:hypothetical protein
MPKKRAGYTQVSLQIPDGLLPHAEKRRGARPLTTYVCELIAADAGVPYHPPPRGRPVKTAKPAPKETPPARKRRGKA